MPIQVPSCDLNYGLLTTSEEIGNNPHASVKAVYDLIIADLLTAAHDLLDGYHRWRIYYVQFGGVTHI